MLIPNMRSIEGVYEREWLDDSGFDESKIKWREYNALDGTPMIDGSYTMQDGIGTGVCMEQDVRQIIARDLHLLWTARNPKPTQEVIDRHLAERRLESRRREEGVAAEAGFSQSEKK